MIANICNAALRFIGIRVVRKPDPRAGTFEASIKRWGHIHDDFH